MTTSQRSWGIQIAAAAMTGAAVWAFLAWIDYEPAFLAGVLVSVISLAGYRWWPVGGRKDNNRRGSRA